MHNNQIIYLQLIKDLFNNHINLYDFLDLVNNLDNNADRKIDSHRDGDTDLTDNADRDVDSGANLARNAHDIAINNQQLINLGLSNNAQISRLEVEILLAHLLNVDRVYFKRSPEALIAKEIVIKFYQLWQRRLKHEPIAYLTGSKSFWDLNIKVTKDVLIPRAATELLVEKTLELIEKQLPFKQQFNILELGTGSGAIALAIANAYPNNVHVIATDISSAALQIAKLNARNLNINNITLLDGDWFTALNFAKLTMHDIELIKAKFITAKFIKTENKKFQYTHIKPSDIFKFDFIISNPPYIASTEKYLCDQEIFFEPQNALFAEEHGLVHLKNIISNSKNYLTTAGVLLLEHGIFQKLQVINCLQVAGFKDIKPFKDLLNIDRMVIAS